MESEQLTRAVAELLADAGLDATGCETRAIKGGRNNRVFAVLTRDERYVAKMYFADPADARPRLRVEYSFLSYAHGIGLRSVPRPIACCADKNIGVYEFVEGRKLDAAELTRDHVLAAARFIRSLNAESDRDLAAGLPTASAGGFSFAEHFSRIQRRVERVRAVSDETRVGAELRSFVAEIDAALSDTRRRVLTATAGDGELEADDRCVSPSDFGFHNALVRESGDVCFIDFEYAGWDDPAKMAADFFSQPAIPVPFEHFTPFLGEALSYSANQSALAGRTRLLLPAIQLEWCCILLNEFLPEAASRREFAAPLIERRERKRLQLEKARRLFNSRTT